MEKIFIRENGDKVRISASFYFDSISRKANYSFAVYKCLKGKRTWTEVCDKNSYSFRLLSMSQRREKSIEEYLQVVSLEEVNDILNMLWQTLKPELLSTQIK